MYCTYSLIPAALTPLPPSHLHPPTSEWDPASDPHLPVNYDASSFREGKAACKAALQAELGLPVDASIPLIAFIGRLDPQKGADILLEVRAERSTAPHRSSRVSPSTTSTVVPLCVSGFCPSIENQE